MSWIPFSPRDAYSGLVRRIGYLDRQLTKLGAEEIPPAPVRPERVTAVVSGVSSINSASVGHLRREVERLRRRAESLSQDDPKVQAVLENLRNLQEIVERQAARLRPLR
jgi:hypothetical protein